MDQTSGRDQGKIAAELMSFALVPLLLAGSLLQEDAMRRSLSPEEIERQWREYEQDMRRLSDWKPRSRHSRAKNLGPYRSSQ